MILERTLGKPFYCESGVQQDPTLHNRHSIVVDFWTDTNIIFAGIILVHENLGLIFWYEEQVL